MTQQLERTPSVVSTVADYKFRCHKLGTLFSGIKIGLNKGETARYNWLIEKRQKHPLTDKQKEEKETLLKRKYDPTVKDITPKQEGRLKYLEEKANMPRLTSKEQTELNELQKQKDKTSVDLSKGGISYIDSILHDIAFNRHTNITSMYLDKGLAVEQKSLTLAQQVLGLYMQKNTERFSDDYITGEPDHILNGEEIVDIKSSWSRQSFPFGSDKYDSMYYYQLHGYMRLTGLVKSRLIHTLVDTPYQLIDDAIRRLSWQLGHTSVDSVPKEVLRETVMDHIFTYDGLVGYCNHNLNIDINWFDGHFIDIPKENRVRSIQIDMSDETMELMNRVLPVAKKRLIDEFTKLVQNNKQINLSHVQ